jgi:streptogramin lyase
MSAYRIDTKYIFQRVWFSLLASLLISCQGQKDIPQGATVPNADVSPSHISGNPTRNAHLSVDGPVKVDLAYVLPSTTVTNLVGAQNKVQRNKQYISTSNTKFIVTVTPLSGSVTGPFTGTCTTANCAVSFTAAPGPNTITISLSDAANVVLSSFNALVFIQPASTNTLNFTANPIVASVVLQLNSASVNAGTAVDDLLSVNAKDPDGNTIIGNGRYLDVNGNPVNLLLNVSNNQAGGSGTVKITGPTVVNTSAHAAINAHYDGKWLASSTISATTSSSAAIGVTPVTLTTTPFATEYSTGLSAGAQPQGLTVGPDGNLWTGEYKSGAGNTVAKITPTGVITEFSNGNASGVAFLAVGPDGNIWFTHTNDIGRITPSGTITQFSGMTGGNSIAITPGPDGNLWFTEYNGNKLARITTNGVLKEYGLNGSQPMGIVLGPDGNLWITYENSAMLSRVTTNGVETDFTYTDTHNLGNNDCIVVGPDGNLWFPDEGGYYIYQYNMNSSALTRFTTGITNNADIRCIAAGPDGNLWFTEQNTGFIGSITPGGTVTEYPTGATNGISAGNGPLGITLGPDGNLWFAESSGNRIAKFVL